MLKFVVIIMITFAEGKQGHEKRVARAAFCRIRLPAHGVTCGVDQERAVLEYHYFCDTTDEKCAERADPAIPQGAEHCGQNKTHEHSEQMNMAMLPHDQRIFLQVGYIIERWLWPQLEQHPADVRVEKTFGDIVRISVVIDMFMMPAMVTCTHPDRIFKRSSPE